MNKKPTTKKGAGRKPRPLRRIAVRIRTLEQFGVERGDRAIISTDGDIRLGELGYFCIKSGYDNTTHNQFAFVCERDSTCHNFGKDISKIEGVCLRTETRQCRGAHEATLCGRVIAFEREGLSVEATLTLRPVAGYEPPPCETTEGKQAAPPYFHLPDVHHEMAREIFWQFDATPQDLAATGYRPANYQRYLTYRIEQKLNRLARQYGLDRDQLTRSQLYLSACRARSVETKGVTSNNGDINGIINAVLCLRGAAPPTPTQRRERVNYNPPTPLGGNVADSLKGDDEARDEEWPDILDLGESEVA